MVCPMGQFKVTNVIKTDNQFILKYRPLFSHPLLHSIDYNIIGIGIHNFLAGPLIFCHQRSSICQVDISVIF